MGLVCLPCSDAFLSAGSLWQKWLEFVNMFELPWNIICGSTCYFLKYDLMMMIRVMVTAVIVQVTTSILLFLLLHHFFYCFLFLCLPAAYYFTYIFLFILLLSLHWNFWRCLHGLISPQVHSHTTHDFFLYCLGFPPVFLRCDVNEIKLHQWTCATKEKAEPFISLMPRYIFSFIMSFSSHIFIYSFLYYFSAPHFTNLASLHSVAIVVVYLI